VAFLWALPVLLLVVLNWEPISSWMTGGQRAEWAAAIGSIAAAWAAVWAAVYPQRVRRLEEKIDGAAEASTHRNAVGMVQAGLVDLVRSYGITKDKLDIARPAMLAARNATRIAAGLGAEQLAQARANERAAEEEFTKWLENLKRIGAKLDTSRLTLEAVPISIIRRFDFLLASDIAQGINQLHAVKGLFDQGAAASILKIGIDAAIAALDRFVRRVAKADELVRNQRDKVKE